MLMMNTDDVIYAMCLLVSMVTGPFVRHIKNESYRKILCTSFGILLVVIVSGLHASHCIVSTLFGALTTLYIHPSKCHLVTFGIMFGYLIFFRNAGLFGFSSVSGHTNMIQMILTLKVSGIAFERNSFWKNQLRFEDNQISLNKFKDNDANFRSVGLKEIFHYSFNYIGVLTGPYYRYRTYCDYFEMPFKYHAKNIEFTVEKLKFAAFYCLLYLTSNYMWPLEYALSDDFYNNRSWVYRLMYIWPTFFIFRMRIYAGLTLSECVCTAAGFGAYPNDIKVSNGEGPKEKYSHLKDTARYLNYNFKTIVNTRVSKVETCLTFREAMKHWNICVQYWLAVNIYKLYPNKQHRTFITLLCSAYWHGFRPGHYLCIMGAPIYVSLEDMWNKLLTRNTNSKLCWVINLLFWTAKFFAFSYLGMAFLLGSFTNIWRFYSSVYHIGYIFWVSMLVLGIVLTNRKQC